jgi:hypothetical protein
MKSVVFYSVVLGACLAAAPAAAQVLGSCGTDQADVPQATVQPPASAVAPSVLVSRVPLPGERAPNFDLIAVVGDEISRVRLSDHDGKWRVVCFYPADFTFV